MSADQQSASEFDLGASPSKLGDDASAAELRKVGYEVTDFAGAFTPGARFTVTVGRSGTTIVRGPLTIERVGSLEIRSGRASTFDPLDKARIDRSLLKLDRQVSPGDHPVFVSRHDDALVALLVRFSGARPMRWSPAHLYEADVDVDVAAQATPPARPERAGGDVFGFFESPRGGAPSSPRPQTRSATRYAFALADSALLDDIMASVMVGQSLEEINKMRVLFGGAPLGPGDPLPGKKLPNGSHPALDALGEQLRAARTGASHGAVAIVEDQPVTSFWGLDERGEIAALACDLGKMRTSAVEVIDVPLVDLHLSMRMQVAGLTLYDYPSHVLVCAPASTVVLQVTLVSGGAETSPATRTGRREDGSQEHELTVSADERIRGTLRLRLGGANRPAARI